MQKLERKFERVVKELRKRYSFLDDVSIDVVEGYGLERTSRHDPRRNFIYLDLRALYKVYNTPRFLKRLGKARTFDEFVLLVLLHEIAHVQQFQTIPVHRLNAAISESDYDTISGHDECWVEQEADEWAKRELRKIKRQRSITI